MPRANKTKKVRGCRKGEKTTPMKDSSQINAKKNLHGRRAVEGKAFSR
jgi:hypothetical protein